MLEVQKDVNELVDKLKESTIYFILCMIPFDIANSKIFLENIV